MIDLRNDINRKEIPENENPKKLVNIIEKVLTPKQMFQRLLTALASKSERYIWKLIKWNLKIYILCIEKNKLLKKYKTIQLNLIKL